MASRLEPRYWLDEEKQELINATLWQARYQQRSACYGCSYHILSPHLEREGVFFSIAKPAESTYTQPKHIKPGIVKSTDDGTSWQFVTTQMEIDELLFIDCNGHLYGTRFRNSEGRAMLVSTNSGRSWQKLEGIPTDITSMSHVIGADGRMYFYDNKAVYRSREAICCSYDRKPSIQTETDKCDGITMPSLEPVRLTIAANTTEKIETGVFLKKGDYACVVVKGETILSFPDGLDIVETAAGRLSPGRKGKKDPEFNLGQLLILYGEEKYGCDYFSLKEADCEYLPDEIFQKGIFWTELKGNYFIVEKEGQIELEINCQLPFKIDGSFEIKIYTLTQYQHESRNCFNKCPKKEPIASIDINHSEWSTGELSQNLVIDWFGGSVIDWFIDDGIEKCYHPDGEDYRGLSVDVMGCQCVYDYSYHQLINDTENLALGTFDYGLIPEVEGWIERRRMHYILDVFPHIAYLKADPYQRYYETPKQNIY